MTIRASKVPTTQEAGIPLTKDQYDKLRLLEQLIGVDLNDWLNLADYPSDRWEAWQVFNNRFAFYDLLTVGEYESLLNLWRTFRYLIIDLSTLLDPDKYDLTDLQQTRYDLEERMTYCDCFQGVMVVAGDPQAGKSCFTAVHTLHGREWFNLKIITYKTKYPSGHGTTEYLDDEDFIRELSKTTNILELKTNDAALHWNSKEEKENFLSRFYHSQIVVEEAHKVIHREHRTRLERFWKFFLKEIFHFHCQVIFVTQYPDELIDEVQPSKGRNQTANVSLHFTEQGKSDVEIYVKDTRQRKPIYTITRKNYTAIWRSDAPIAMDSNISTKRIGELKQEQKDKMVRENQKEEA